MHHADLNTSYIKNNKKTTNFKNPSFKFVKIRDFTEFSKFLKNRILDQ